MAKTLVTHINPHLDDILAIWLFKKYHSDFADANLEFISASRDRTAKDETGEKVFLGTGGGQFDEHKEGLETCAGSLVFEYLKENRLLPEDEISTKALERLVEWNKRIDLGKAGPSEVNEFSVQAFIRPLDGKVESSKKAVELGEQILDRILEVLKKREQSLEDWKKAVGFESKFGKSYAVISETVDRAFCKQLGGDLFLMLDPRYKSVQFYSDSADLEPIYKKVKELDPEASWFLHQSHHMVICGSGSAPDSTPTKLKLEQLIEVAKSI